MSFIVYTLGDLSSRYHNLTRSSSDLDPSLIAANAGKSDHPALKLGFIGHVRYCPDCLQRVAWFDRREEAAVVLKIRNGRSREIDPDRSRDKRAGEGPVQNASTEAGLTGKGLIHMQWVEIPKQTCCRDQMGLSNSEHIIELIAHAHFIVRSALWNPHVTYPHR